MWARVIELMLGVWLCLSPIVFHGTPSADAFATIDLAAGTAIAILSLLSFWQRTHWAHFGTLAIAVVLGTSAYLGWPRPGPPAAQNELMAAMLLVLFTIVPNEASAPPRPWRHPR